MVDIGTALKMSDKMKHRIKSHKRYIDRRYTCGEDSVYDEMSKLYLATPKKLKMLFDSDITFLKSITQYVLDTPIYVMPKENIENIIGCRVNTVSCDVVNGVVYIIPKEEFKMSILTSLYSIIRPKNKKLVCLLEYESALLCELIALRYFKNAEDRRGGFGLSEDNMNDIMSTVRKMVHGMRFMSYIAVRTNSLYFKFASKVYGLICKLFKI